MESMRQISVSLSIVRCKVLDETLASSEDGRRYILFDVKPVGLVVESWGSLLGIAVGDPATSMRNKHVKRCCSV